MNNSLESKIRQAVQAFQAGNLDAAEIILEKILRKDSRNLPALNILGLIKASQSKPKEAAVLLKKAIGINPSDPSLRYNLAKALQESGADKESLPHHKKAVEFSPHDHDAWLSYGISLSRLGLYDDALDIYKKSLSIKPDNHVALLNMGVALKELKQYDEALTYADKSIAVNPNLPEAWSNKGVVHRELKQFDAAFACYDRAISLKPNFAEGYANRGVALQELKRLEQAIASYGYAISIKPDYVQAWYGRANALQELERYDEALLNYDNLLRIKPDHAEGHSHRGNALMRLKRFDEACSSYDRAIVLAPYYAEAYSNRGLVLEKLKQLEKALANYDLAISIEPDYVEAYFNRGTLFHVKLHRLDEALENYDLAIRKKPDYAAAFWNKSLALLLRGDLPKGWDLHEWRWKVAQSTVQRGQFAADWNGEVILGALLVLAEQGVGDEIFYAGMLNDLSSFAASVTVMVDPRLLALYRRSFQGIEVIAKTTSVAPRAFDAQVYIGSLGQYLRPDMDSLKKVTHGYLRACEVRAGAMRSSLKRDGKLLCGLSWSSQSLAVGDEKSIRLQQLAPLLALEEFDYVDLQYGDTTAEREAVRISTGRTLRSEDSVDNFNDIDGLAALISACDVVVTVSNTTAHLAAALGKSVFVLLPYAHGLLWYWHAGRSDSPWYPGVRLYRQERSGDWEAVLARVRADLANLCSDAL